jgi:hypothetical protein
LPGAVAREEEPLAARVPDREREHPVEALDEGLAELLVEVDDHLAVRARAEGVPLRAQLVAQGLEVVDLAVDHDRDGAVLVDQGLRGLGREVDDGEAAVAERAGAHAHVPSASGPRWASARLIARTASRWRAPGSPGSRARKPAMPHTVVSRGKSCHRDGGG